ncbi:hypothetical protein GQ457_07G025690 [Hibiscus cannabinus]
MYTTIVRLKRQGAMSRVSVDVRFSKVEKDEYYSGKHVTKILVSDHNSRGMHGADHDALAAASESDTNDFRPTTPGHSPSIGHSTPPNGH